MTYEIKPRFRKASAAEFSVADEKEPQHMPAVQMREETPKERA
jgi:hypothetical protein